MPAVCRAHFWSCEKTLYLQSVSCGRNLKFGQIIPCGIAALLLLSACGRDDGPQARTVEVVLGIGGGADTKTSLGDDGHSFFWDRGDAIAVWARNSEGDFAIDGQRFTLMASPDNNRSVAYFSSTLASEMPEDTYTYYMTYPVPDAVNGTVARFSVPEMQTGDVSGGLDITVAEPVRGAALRPAPEAGPVEESMSVTMRHLLHFLKFYIPEGRNLLGEPVSKIVFTMPQAVAGELEVDASNPESAVLKNGTETVEMRLASPIDESGADGMQDAIAAIFPPETACASGDELEVEIYSDSKYSTVHFNIAGRTFAAGHFTRVPLKPVVVHDRYTVKFTLSSNNLGEDLQNISLSLPEGVNWPGTSSNVYTYSKPDGTLIAAGDTFLLDTVEEEEFRAISSQPVTVRYESENAVLSESLAVADLSGVTSAGLSLNCPYLFFEDFSRVESFSSNDEFSKGTQVGGTLGNKNPTTFLDGWSAARAGAQAGTAIRLACRREASSDYSARADSPFLTGLKEGKTVNLSIQFDYSMNREEYAFIVSKPNAKQTVYCGYITTSDNLGSNSDVGTYPIEFVVDETTGSYSNINNSTSFVLEAVGSPIRLSWRSLPVHVAGTTSSTCWLYLDNIKVKIKK